MCPRTQANTVQPTQRRGPFPVLSPPRPVRRVANLLQCTGRKVLQRTPMKVLQDPPPFVALAEALYCKGMLEHKHKHKHKLTRMLQDSHLVALAEAWS